MSEGEQEGAGMVAGNGLSRVATVKEAADALRVHPQTVRRLIKSGELASVTVGQRAIRVPWTAINRLVDGAAP